MIQEPPIGPITKNAVLGVLCGLTAGTIYASLVDTFTLAQGALGGFVGGLVGGTLWGLITSRRPSSTLV